MKKLERYLCAGCVKNMEKAQLIFKKVPGTEGSLTMKRNCEWCGRSCYGASYKIMYGGRIERDNATATDAGGD